MELSPYKVRLKQAVHGCCGHKKQKMRLIFRYDPVAQSGLIKTLFSGELLTFCILARSRSSM